ncbi:hypothetical protein ACJX0J_028440, partial [Zea mays]
ATFVFGDFQVLWNKLDDILLNPRVWRYEQEPYNKIEAGMMDNNFAIDGLKQKHINSTWGSLLKNDKIPLIKLKYNHSSKNHKNLIASGKNLSLFGVDLPREPETNLI